MADFCCTDCERSGELPKGALCMCRGWNRNNAHLNRVATGWRVKTTQPPRTGQFWHPSTEWVQWPGKEWGLRDYGQPMWHPGMVNLRHTRVIATQFAPGFVPIPETPVAHTKDPDFTNVITEAYFRGSVYLRCADETQHDCTAGCERVLADAPPSDTSCTEHTFADRAEQTVKNAQSRGARRSTLMQKKLAAAAKHVCKIRF